MSGITDERNKFLKKANNMIIFPLTICGVVSIAGAAALVHWTPLDFSAVLALTVTPFLVLLVWLLIWNKNERQILSDADLNEILDEKLSVLIEKNQSPAFLHNSDKRLLWGNKAFDELTSDAPIMIGQDVSMLLRSSAGSEDRVTYGNKAFECRSFVVSEENDYILTVMDDVTDFEELKTKYNDERSVVAYIAIDNVEDVLLYVREKFQDAVIAVDEKIHEWAKKMNAVLKSYDNDKYIMFFNEKQLSECVKNRFEILDEIRNTRVGDGVSVTVSIGVSDIEGTLAEREIAARDAIDFALQRGGDQAVYRSSEGTEYFGGKTKSIYKRSNVKSRTFTNQLTAMIARADNVLVMGHKYGDFDSIGASIGVARLASLCGTKVNIAVDTRDKNLAPCIALMEQTDFYSSVFVDNAAAFDLCTPDTLVILVDHNSPERSQFPDLNKHVSRIAIIDHHRRIDDIPEKVQLYYIEPSASSTCEMVSEMLEAAISSQSLLKEEADLLFAGILLDTKQFTRNTGTRTFGAAQYLRGAGASPGDVYTLFKTDPEELAKEARFHTAITTYRGNVAISAVEGNTDESYRIIASLAADKMLTLRGIDASFTLVRIGEKIHISGRSNGQINVQLILERLHGGGHFEMAGAQVENESVIAVLEQLKSSIDIALDQ